MTVLPALVLAAALAAPPPLAGPLAPLTPLLGDWAGDPTDQPGAPIRARATFTTELDGKVVVRRNRVEFPPAADGSKGPVHEDLLVIWPEPDGLKASYFDNEGHVVQYRVVVDAPRLVFESTSESGPSYRLEYAPRGEGWEVTFSMARVGGPFRTMQAGTMRRPGAGG